MIVINKVLVKRDRNKVYFMCFVYDFLGRCFRMFFKIMGVLQQKNYIMNIKKVNQSFILKEVKFNSRYWEVVLRIFVLGIGRLFIMNINVNSCSSFMILNMIM